MTNFAEIAAAFRNASAAADASFAVYQPIRDAFSAGKISAAEFIAARAKHDAALMSYDAASIACQELPETFDVWSTEQAEAVETEFQLALF